MSAQVDPNRETERVCYGPLRVFIADESSWECMTCGWVGWPAVKSERYRDTWRYFGWHLRRPVRITPPPVLGL